MQAGDPHPGTQQTVIAPPEFLRQRETGAAALGQPQPRLEHVVQPRRSLEFDIHGSYGHHQIFALALAVLLDAAPEELTPRYKRAFELGLAGKSVLEST